MPVLGVACHPKVLPSLGRSVFLAHSAARANGPVLSDLTLPMERPSSTHPPPAEARSAAPRSQTAAVWDGTRPAAASTARASSLPPVFTMEDARYVAVNGLNVPANPPVGNWRLRVDSRRVTAQPEFCASLPQSGHCERYTGFHSFSIPDGGAGPPVADGRYPMPMRAAPAQSPRPVRQDTTLRAALQ